MYTPFIPEEEEAKTDLGKTFKQLQRKKAFQELIDVAGDVVNGLVLLEEESEYATYGLLVLFSQKDKSDKVLLHEEFLKGNYTGIADAQQRERQCDEA